MDKLWNFILGKLWEPWLKTGYMCSLTLVQHQCGIFHYKSCIVKEKAPNQVCNFYQWALNKIVDNYFLSKSNLLLKQNFNICVLNI